MSDINTYNWRNVYPSAAGATVATGATGSNTGMMQGGGRVPNTDAPDVLDRAKAIGGQASPVVAALVLLGLVAGLMFLAKRLGTDDDFRSIRPTLYNGLTISAAAIVFMPLWKYAFTRFPIPGATTWVLAA